MSDFEVEEFAVPEPAPTGEFSALTALTQVLQDMTESKGALERAAPPPGGSAPVPEEGYESAAAATARWSSLLAEREALWERERRALKVQVAALRNEVAELEAELAESRRANALTEP